MAVRMTKNKPVILEYTCAPGVNSQSFEMNYRTKDGKPASVRVRGGCGMYFVPKPHAKKFENLPHIKKLFTSGRLVRSGGESNSGGAAKGEDPASAVEPSTAASLETETPEPETTTPAEPAEPDPPKEKIKAASKGKTK